MCEEFLLSWRKVCMCGAKYKGVFLELSLCEIAV